MQRGMSMKIVKFNDSYISDVVKLWNKSAKAEMPYKPFTEASFRDKFINNPHFSYEGTFVGIEDEKVIAFANGIFKKEFLPGETYENTPGYLTFILVDKPYRRNGYGSMMLKSVEDYFIACGKKQVQIIFFNPINLEWYIPGSKNHDHPNAPGVDMDGPGYEFLKKHGYEKRSREVSMYLDLSKYELSEKTISKLEELKAKGIYIEYYNEDKHYGFDEFFDNLKNEYWRKDIKDNLARPNPLPVLVANDNGKICGFTGPIDVEQSGRGWFCGIGVDPGYGGDGIGTTLFCMLMKSFKDIGAQFSSLFTGLDNPARKIYERAGFTVIKTWAVMRKEIM